MGVDYTPVAGVGVTLDTSTIEGINNKLEEQQIDASEAEYIHHLFTGTGVGASEYGCYFYTGDIRDLGIALTCVDGGIHFAQSDIDVVNSKLGTSFTVDDVKLIKEMWTW